MYKPKGANPHPLEMLFCGVFMSEKLKGTHVDDKCLEYIVKSDKPLSPEEYLSFIKSVRDLAYSIGYRHGHEDKVKGL